MEKKKKKRAGPVSAAAYAQTFGLMLTPWVQCSRAGTQAATRGPLWWAGLYSLEPRPYGAAEA